jgi:hypothetical protein
MKKIVRQTKIIKENFSDMAANFLKKPSLGTPERDDEAAAVALQYADNFVVDDFEIGSVARRTTPHPGADSGEVKH